MKRRLLISPRANQDIDEQFAYLAEENFATAVQFYDAAFQTFDDLLLRPFKGAARRSLMLNWLIYGSGSFKVLKNV